MSDAQQDSSRNADSEKRRSVKQALARRLGLAGKSDISIPDIPEEHYRFDRRPEYQALKQKQDIGIRLRIRNPFFTVHEQLMNEQTVVDGRICINYAGYNYLGMSGDPVVSQATKDAIDRYGTSVSSSRIMAGEKPIHQELESALAELTGAAACHVYVGGFSTNVTTIGHLLGPKDLILHDALIHNSVLQGSILSGARRVAFPHNDYDAVERLLKAERADYEQVMIIIEGVYGMDGDIPDLPRLIDLRNTYKTYLMVDEAHSMGVIGAHGRGIREYFGTNPEEVDIWMGTLSKSFASCGGYIAGTSALIEYLKYTVPGSVYSVGLSPPDTAAALAAVRLMRAEPDRVQRLQARARFFLESARGKGLNTGLSQDSAVIPIIIGSSLVTARLAQALFEEGVIVQPVLHPGVEEKATRLRFFITCRHTETQIRDTVDLLAKTFNRLR